VSVKTDFTTAVQRFAASEPSRKITSSRVVVKFSDAANDWLNEQSQRHRISVADVVRRIVDETRGAYFVGPKR
jgi:hypothetical protein